MKSVEIELFECCNRKCSFCPNSNLDNNELSHMDSKTFNNLINVLMESDNIHLCGYSEHTMFGIEYIKAKLDEIKKLDKYFTLNTNGDYMSNISDWLYYFDRIDISRYDGDFMNYVFYIINLLPDFEITTFNKHMVILHGGNKKVKIMDIVNLKKMCNRGGLISELNIKHIRKSPCNIFPINEYVFINTKGNVYPCCNLNDKFSDSHNELKLFNVNDLTIDNSKIYNIKNNLSNNPYVYDSCRYCGYKEGDYNQ